MEYAVYGRNAVEKYPVQLANEHEIGIIVETHSADVEAANLLASLITHYMVHYGYPDRKSTAGNLAYPFSPNTIPFKRKDGSFGALVLSGTRDPIFQQKYEIIKTAVLDEIKQQFPDALKDATFTITIADKQNPAIIVRTVAKDQEELLTKHRQELAELKNLIHFKPQSIFEMQTLDCYEWSLYHLITNEEVIKKEFFPHHLV